jgi:glycosyltransferase involved in cell wall biosynthesis
VTKGRLALPAVEMLLNIGLPWALPGVTSIGKSANMVLAPQVGVVIANHDNGAFIDRSILSVAQQTVKDLRVVVVDDASADNSDEAIRRQLQKLGDDRFRYIRLPSNLGQAGALRRGLAELDTPFICFLDSDDFWHEGFVARHLEAHLNGDFPVALTYCDSHIIDAQGRLLAGTAWWFDNNPTLSSRRALDYSSVPRIDGRTGEMSYPFKNTITLLPEWSPDGATNTTSSMMLRRDFVDLVFSAPDADLRLYVDFYLSTLAGLLTGVIAIHEPLYAYRMHGRNKHSDAVVFGGAYNSSTKPWQPVRTSVLKVILGVLETEADAIQTAFGAARHGQALAMIQHELFEKTPAARSASIDGGLTRKLLGYVRARLGPRNQRL